MRCLYADAAPTYLPILRYDPQILLFVQILRCDGAGSRSAPAKLPKLAWSQARGLAEDADEIILRSETGVK